VPHDLVVVDHREALDRAHTFAVAPRWGALRPGSRSLHHSAGVCTTSRAVNAP
jgi:hypothetical protein